MNVSKTLNPSTDTLNLIDFLNGRAICVVVREGAKDTYHTFTFSDDKGDTMDIVSRHFTNNAEEIEGTVVASLDRRLADCYMFFPHSYRSTSNQELWEEICKLGNENIKAARRTLIVRQIEAIDAKKAELNALLEG